MTGFAPDLELVRQLGVPIDKTTGIPEHDPATLETSRPGVFVAGVVVAGYDANKVFIENGRYHGDKIVARILGQSPPPEARLSAELDTWGWPTFWHERLSRCDGEAGFAGQAARLHFSVVGDLWGRCVRLGLRSARSGAQAQPAGPVVARHGAPAGRHRRPRLGDPHASQGVGGERA